MRFLLFESSRPLNRSAAPWSPKLLFPADRGLSYRSLHSFPHARRSFRAQSSLPWRHAGMEVPSPEGPFQASTTIRDWNGLGNDSSLLLVSDQYSWRTRPWKAPDDRQRWTFASLAAQMDGDILNAIRLRLEYQCRLQQGLHD